MLILNRDWQPLDEIEDPDVKERKLVNLLHVGRLWDIAEAAVFAQHQLHLMNLPASRRLQLARMYSLYDWIHDAMLSLVTGKLDWLSDEDIGRLDIKVFSIIAKAKETLWYETQLACRVPPELDPNPQWVSDEHDHRVCTEVFNEVWWEVIAKKVINPVKPLRFCEIADEIRKTPFQVQRVSGWKKMEYACKEDVLKKIESPGFFSESDVVHAASLAVERYFKSL